MKALNIFIPLLIFLDSSNELEALTKEVRPHERSNVNAAEIHDMFPFPILQDIASFLCDESDETASLCLVGGSMTGEEATTACAQVDCCQGSTPCKWDNKLEVCLATGACNGREACWLSNDLPDGASFIVGANSCSGDLSCYNLGVPSIIGDGSCIGEYACESSFGMSYNIGDGSCIGDSACYAMNTGSEVGDNSCLFESACFLMGDVGDNQFQNEHRL